MESILYLIFCTLLGGNSGNDLLSLIPTEAYWQAKGVDVSVVNIIIELNSIKPDDTSKEMAVRKLMAIRTLGELKNPDAVGAIKPFLDSKEMFVAEYAQRAIDAIDGKAPSKTSGVPPARMKQDLYMLPSHCGAVAQVRMMPGKPATMPAAKEGEDAAGVDPRNAMQQMTNSLIYVAEMTGNIRVDAVTIGVADEVGPQQGFLTLIVRGQWDADAVKGALQPTLNQSKTANEVEFMSASFGGLDVVVPSNDLLVLVSGPPNNNLPLDDIATAIKTGKGTFSDSADLINVVNTVDTTQRTWAAMLVGENYRQADQLAPFDSMTMVGKSTNDGMKYEAKAVGKDPDAVKDGVEKFKQLIDDAKGGLTPQVDQTLSVKPLLNFLNGIELKADGTTATGTAVMKPPMQ